MLVGENILISTFFLWAWGINFLINTSTHIPTSTQPTIGNSTPKSWDQLFYFVQLANTYEPRKNSQQQQQKPPIKSLTYQWPDHPVAWSTDVSVATIFCIIKPVAVLDEALSCSKHFSSMPSRQQRICIPSQVKVPLTKEFKPKKYATWGKKKFF